MTKTYLREFPPFFRKVQLKTKMRLDDWLKKHNLKIEYLGVLKGRIIPDCLDTFQIEGLYKRPKIFDIPLPWTTKIVFKTYSKKDVWHELAAEVLSGPVYINGKRVVTPDIFDIPKELPPEEFYQDYYEELT